MSGALDVQTLEQAFRVAAGELGMCDAAWRFVDELEGEGGAPLIEAARDALGRTFPVLDAVCGRRLDGAAAPSVEVAAVVEACAGLRRLVVVGVEARWLDALLGASRGLDVAVLPATALPGDLERLAANLPAAVPLTSLGDFQRFAGPRSGLLTFVYGATAQGAFVLPEWVRTQGPDVRSQFRSFIGWEVLAAPPDVYPRWLIEVPTSQFTALVT
ncbi:MAG: hypothetical protein MUC96_20070 [Myxococcaceae bacterium]|jgi:hypothetical protein|nr:hypothetical protein [Myxococcaceae bacterium]